MTPERFIEMLDRDDEYLKYDRIENMRHPRRDIAAFLLLSELVPSDGTIIEGADHDIIYLTDITTLCDAGITEEQVIELVRLGCSQMDGEYMTMYV